MKKYAFISDIHGNSFALSAVLNDIDQRGISAVYNLGDSLFGPLDPHGTFALLQKSSLTHLMGNGDRELLAPTDTSSSTMNQVRLGLTPEERGWLENLPPAIEADGFLMFHASPGADSTYFLEEILEGAVRLKPQDVLSHELTGIAAKVLVFGHSHVPRVVELAGAPLLVNAGSVGLPAYADEWPVAHKMESGTPHAKYVIVEEMADKPRAQIIEVPYDWRAAARLALNNKRPDWAEWLASGLA
jgi:predicted phosphodiesterase